jgi:glycosyltransferase involved in cell wall biosynthesis
MLFSIITPNYNSGKFIRNCIESVRRQNCEVEHIVMDGGSSDESADVVRQYPEVRWYSERDSGMYDAVNKGIRRASGDVIAYLNADDRYPDSALARVAQALRNDPDADYAYGACRYIDSREMPLYTYAPPPLPRFVLRRIARVPWAQAATFWTRKVFNKVGYFDTRFKYIGDYDFLMRTMKANLSGIRVKSCLAEFMLHEEALSETAKTAMLQEYLDLQAENAAFTPGLLDQVFEAYNKLYNARNFIRKQRIQLHQAWSAPR